MLSLDTNILVYAADATAGLKHAAAKMVLDKAAPAGAALTEQSLFEFFHACTRKGKLTASEAQLVVGQLLQDFTMMLPHGTIVNDALAVQLRYHLNIWDARLVAVCSAHGCDHLLSEDLQDGAQYGGVRIVNPFNPPNAGLIGRLLS
jgi:predicted nucleic acid-binding protein